MDTAAFAAALDGMFDGPLADGVPRDARFAAVAAEVPGFTTPAELAVLNLAARMLPAGEAYLEVGTFKGRSLCGTLLDAPDRSYLAVENFQEFGMVAGSSRAELARHLDRYVAGHRLVLHDADCFRLLARPDPVPEPVGVYFYDRRHPGWTELRDIRAPRDHDSRWANGMLLLAYRRPPGAAHRMTGDVRWRRAVQVHLRAPATALVWRSLHRLPWLVPLAKRLVPKRSRTVPAGVGADGSTAGVDLVGDER